MMKTLSGSLAGVALVALALGGCGGATPAPDTAAAGAGDQVAMGAKLYGEQCAHCHGDSGQGAGAPALVGASALPLDPPAGAKFRKTQFHTGADVFAFVKEAMPPGKGGSLTDEQYAAILAFDLKANGVDMTGKHVDAKTAPTFVLHP